MTAYYKLSGGGNDFLGLIEPRENPTRRQIRAWCRRGVSLGADGVFVLRRTPVGARMDYFNADGGAAELCLNGTRCAVRLALHLDWASDCIEIETGAGEITGERTGRSEVSLQLPIPSPPNSREVPLGDRRLAGWEVTVGVPHFVLPWPETLQQAPVDKLGAALRAHPDFGPPGINVDFVRFVEPHQIEIRTYERGVEGETLTCGTGVLAAVAVGLRMGVLSLPVEALTLGGFTLRVAAAESRPEHWSLAGDARLVSRGELLAGSEEVPELAKWS